MKAIGERFFHELFDNISDIILIIDKNGIIKNASPSIKKMLGFSQAELQTKKIFDYLHPDDSEMVKNIHQAMLDGNPVNGQTNIRVRHKNGSYRNIIGSRKNMLDNPDINGIILTGHDITEMTRINQTAQRTTDLLNSVESISNIGGWEYDVLNDSLFWTNEVLNIYGLNPVDLPEDTAGIIRLVSAMYSIEDRKIIRDAYNECISKGTKADLEFRISNAGGDKIWTRIIANPVTENNKVVKLIGNVSNISPQKKMQTLLQARLKLEEFSYHSDLDTFLKELLDEAEKLTDSEIGFYHFVNDDQENLTLQTWSTNTLNKMCNAEGKGVHYSISKAGVWAECFYKRKPVIHNDYERLPNKKGMPEGHAKVIREISIPLIKNNKIVSIIGLGNKPKDYNDEDVRVVQQLADLAWNIVERKRSEKLLSEKERHLNAIFENSPIAKREENFSKVKVYFDDLRAMGITNIEQYLEEHPEDLPMLASSIDIVLENKESVELLGSKDNSEAQKDISNLLIKESLSIFKQEMIALWEGNSEFECEMPLKTLNGRKIILFMKLGVLPGYMDTLEKVLVSFVDITELKEAEKALKENQELSLAKNKELEEKNLELTKARHAMLNIIEDLSIEIKQREKIEKALRESEEKFRSLFENHSAVKLLIDPDNGDIVEANKAAAKYYGWTKSDMEKRSLNQINTLPKEQLFEKVREVLQNKTTHFELQHRLSTGEVRDVEIFSSNMEINGKHYLHSIVHDITNKKLIERELQQFFDLVPNMVCIVNIDGKFEKLNNAWEKTLGFSEKEMLNQPFVDFIHPDDIKATLKEVEKQLKGKQTINFINRYRTAGGDYKLLDWIASPSPDGLKIYGTARDITERAKLIENLTKLSTAVEQTKMSIVITNHAGEIEYVNPYFCTITGYHQNDAIGKKLDYFISKDSSKKDFEKMWKKLYAGSTWSGVFHTKKKNGELFWESAILTPIKNEKGIITHYIAVKEDITEKVAREEELDRYRTHLEELVKVRTKELQKLNAGLNEQLQKEKELEMMLRQSLNKEKELNQLKTRFISTASHEFKTPLTIVFSSVEIIERYGENLDINKVSQHLNRIKNSVNYINKLLDEVLTISRVDSGKIKFNPQLTNLKKLCSEIIAELDLTTNKKLDFVYNYQLTKNEYMIDRKLIRFILMNLLSNAFKYSPDKGKVELDISSTDSSLIFNVKDNGIGIPPKDKPYLFEPFHRASNSGDYPGTGLGLSIVKQSVDLHGGKISVNSSLNEGTEFTVIIKV